MIGKFDKVVDDPLSYYETMNCQNRMQGKTKLLNVSIEWYQTSSWDLFIKLAIVRF